MSLKADYVNFQ